MFCKNCGKELSDTVKFCPGCGASVLNTTDFTNNIVIELPAKSKGGLIALTIGGVLIVAGAIGAVTFINIQKNRPLAVAALASQNLSEDILQIANANFSVGVKGQTITGSAAIDYDADVLQAYFSADGIIYALSYENNSGYIYAQTDWGSGGYEMDASMIEDIQAALRSAKDMRENQTVSDADFRQTLEDSGLLDKISEYIIPDQINTTAQKLENRMKNLNTINDLEKALQIEKIDHTYTLPFRSENMADTLGVFITITEEECKELFQGDYLDQFISECSELENEIRNGNYDFGQISWTAEKQCFQNISGNLHADGDSLNLSLDFSYDGSELSGISGSFSENAELITVSLTDINQVSEVIPEEIRTQMH